MFPNVDMGRIVMLLHMTRGMRLFYYIEPLQRFFSLLARLAPIYAQMSMILFIVFWIYTDVGQLWFGGLIYTSNPRLAGTDFASPGFQFFELNFNCFLDGMITLFTLMCMNNWSDTADGYMQATQQYISQAYFVSFTIFVNMIVLNVLIALVLDCSGQQHAQHGAEDDEAAIGISYESILRKAVGVDDSSADAGASDESSSSEDSSSDKDMTASASLSPLRPARKRLTTQKSLISSKISSRTLGSVDTEEDQKKLDRMLGNRRKGSEGRRSVG